MKYTLLIAACILTTLFTACKKEEETQTLVKTMEQVGDTTTYEYNDNAQIVKMASTNGYSFTYSYASNKVNVAYINGPNTSGSNYNAVYNLGNDGMVVSYNSENDGVTTYVYDSDGLLQKTVSSWDTTVYEWENGNIVEEIRSTASGTSIAIYTHYTDKENQMGGKFMGISWTPRSKNLLKSRTISYSGTTDVFDYTYTYDNEGRVTSRLVKVNGVDSPISTIGLTYY